MLDKGSTLYVGWRMEVTDGGWRTKYVGWRVEDRGC